MYHSFTLSSAYGLVGISQFQWWCVRACRAHAPVCVCVCVWNSKHWFTTRSVCVSVCARTRACTAGVTVLFFLIQKTEPVSMHLTGASRPIRDGDEWEKEKDRRVKPRNAEAPTRKTKDAVDCRQNNKTPSGIALRLPHNATAVPTAMQNSQSQRQSVRSSAAVRK